MFYSEAFLKKQTWLYSLMLLRRKRFQVNRELEALRKREWFLYPYKIVLLYLFIYMYFV